MPLINDALFGGVPDVHVTDHGEHAQALSAFLGAKPSKISPVWTMFGGDAKDAAAPAAPPADANAEEGGGKMCFPASATVQESRRGRIYLANVHVGDEIISQGGAVSRVVALMHEDANVVAEYLTLEHDGGKLLISPQHLLFVSHTNTTSGGSNEWSWAAAEQVRPGDMVQNEDGEPLNVFSVKTERAKGMFAPLTVDGVMLVDGVLCSCYAPPTAWSVATHTACHAAMLPFRILEVMRGITERASTTGDKASRPLLTVEPMWLLPRGQHCDKTMHPYCASLLGIGEIAEAVVAKARGPMKAIINNK